MSRTIVLACAVLAGLASVTARQPAGAPAALVLRGGRVVTVSHGVLEGASVVVEGGRIKAVGQKVDTPPGARVIDVSGQWVLPGLIDAFSNLGTADIESYGKDDDEATGPVTPQMRVVDALDPGNRFVGLASRAGVTSALTVPGEGNVLSGQSAVIRLDGERLEQMVLRFPAGIHGALGEAPKLRYGKKEQAPSTRMGQVALLRQTLLDAQGYRDKRARDSAKTPRDLKLEALTPALDGERPFIVSADRRDDILTAMKVAGEFKLRLVVSHGTEAYTIAARLAESRVPVILGPVTADHRRVETGQARADSAAVLAAAGVAIAFQGGLNGMPGGVLAAARQAVANGLAHDLAVRAMTLSAAEILGVADAVGSLDPGKHADIVVFTADPLADATAKVRLVLIGGRLVAGS